MGDPQPLPPSLSPPYVAVIFTSLRTTTSDDEYRTMAERMEKLAAQQPGYLGLESARGGDRVGVTISYWRDRESARAWKNVAEHQGAQRLGRSQFYEWYRVRIAVVSEDWGHDN